MVGALAVTEARLATTEEARALAVDEIKEISLSLLEDQDRWKGLGTVVYCSRPGQ